VLREFGLPDAEDAKVSQKAQNNSKKIQFDFLFGFLSAKPLRLLRLAKSVFYPLCTSLKCAAAPKVKPLIRSLIEQFCALIAHFIVLCFHSPAQIIKVQGQQPNYRSAASTLRGNSSTFPKTRHS
jgi:hypothetical protein